MRKNSWDIPPIFQLMKGEANLDDDDMYRTFNMGIGLVIIAAVDQADKLRIFCEPVVSERG